MNPQLCQALKASLKKIREQLEYLEGLCDPSILSLGAEMDTAATKPTIEAKQEQEDEKRGSDDDEEEDDEDEEEEEAEEIPAPKPVPLATKQPKKKAPRSIRANKPKYSMADLVDPQKYKLMGNGSLSGMVWLKDETGARTGKARHLIFSGAKATPSITTAPVSTPQPATATEPKPVPKKKKVTKKPKPAEVQLFPSKIQNDHLNNLRAVHIGGS